MGFASCIKYEIFVNISHNVHTLQTHGNSTDRQDALSAFQGPSSIAARHASHAAAAAIQVFGNSPDETAYCRVLLNRETTSDAITMIQPAMQAYSMGGAQAEPVMLDVASVTPDRVLLLDSYFTVVVWHGSTVAQWRKADYHLQEEYAHLKPLMEVWVHANSQGCPAPSCSATIYSHTYDTITTLTSAWS